jgi:putative ABC transport system ATP-binding protein
MRESMQSAMQPSPSSARPLRAALGSRPLVRLDRVVKTYASPAGDTVALNGVSATFGHGEFVGIIGKSGAGKSTLVNMIIGVDTLTSGSVWVQDTCVHRLGESARALWRGTHVGVVYQSFELLPTLSLLDNVLLPVDFAGSYRRTESAERALSLLARVGLADHALKTPARISGGQRQRVAIARALANDPPLIVADEPTGNLDSATAGDIIDLFEELVDQGRTVLMVTHDGGLAKRMDRVLHLADGNLASAGFDGQYDA